MKIIFFGSDPWFSPPVLEALLKAGHKVPVVVTKGDALTKNKKQKTKNKIFSLQAKTAEDISRARLDSLLRSDPDVTSGSDLSTPDAIVLASFGPPFLAAEVLTWPKYGCLNVHASLLPRWRGASPVFASLREGDKKTGVSIMRMTEEVDRGATLGMAKTEIRQPKFLRTLPGGLSLRESPWDNRETLTKRLGKLGGELIVETLKKLEKGQITEVNQPEKSPTPYTRRLTKESGRIDWRFRPGETSPERRDAPAGASRSRRIERFIRAVTPWPGAVTSAKFKVQSSKRQTIPILKILKVHLEPIQYSVFSIQYSLVIDEVQLPGKNPVSWKQFLAGHPGAELG